MNRWRAWASALDDRMNPIAVKEFRQAVQSRGVIAILMLFLAVNLAVIGGYVMLSSDAGTSFNGGRGVFMGLLGILMFTCMIFVPLYSGGRMSLERNNADIDLLYVTTLSPGAIVRGKYLTAIALTLLIFSASMPFMILTYLLRGIDLPSIFFVLGVCFVICALADAVGIAAGCMPGKGNFRGIGILAAIFLLPVFPQVIMLAERYLVGGIGWWMQTWQFWSTFGTYFLMILLAVGLLYVLSVALLSPKPSNRMLIPRLYMTGAWAVAGAVMFAWSYVSKSDVPITSWMVGSGAALMLLAVLELGERDAWTARVRRTIPRNRLLRLPAFLFYTGSAGGVAWCVLMFAATMLLARLGSATNVDVYHNLPIVFGYTLCYGLTAAFLRFALLRRVRTTGIPILAAFLAAATWLLPFLIAFFIRQNDMYSAAPWYLLGSPAVLTTNDDAAKHAATLVMLGWLGLCGLLSAPWFVGQWRRFVPYEGSSP